MEIPLWFEIGSLSLLLLILIADLCLIIWRPHVPSMKESALWVGFYVTLALIFALCLFLIGDSQHAGEFIAGWLTEYSLSIDNLFVFVIIMTSFAVPREQQQRVLMVGIIIALILRGAFILVGAAVIENFSWIFYIFGAWLIYTAAKQAFPGDHDSEGQDNAFVRFLKKRIAISDHYDGGKIRTVINGKKFWTPMLMVFIAIGTTDLLFAIDSIPAIFGITQNPFLVFAANLFALMGLRQLYFLLGGLLDKLVYLHYGIAFILAFIGVKLVFHAMHVNELPFINGGEPILWAPEISTWTSLIVIVSAMIVATVASLVKLRATREELKYGPAGAELGDDGKYHIVDQLGNTFVRPVRVERGHAGDAVVIDAQGERAPVESFDNELLRKVIREQIENGEEIGEVAREEAERVVRDRETGNGNLG